jgi:hypothetical protein
MPGGGTPTLAFAGREREVVALLISTWFLTLPHGLFALCQRNPRLLLYALPFQASAAATHELAADPRHFGAQIE